MLCEILKEAGLPPGVVNMIFGEGAAVGEALVKHPDVPLISFTGGTATGARIAATGAPLFKKISLELGMNAIKWDTTLEIRLTYPAHTMVLYSSIDQVERTQH
jgi:delta 1-pyrroline-5-carboxylate dehydrogenase